MISNKRVLIMIFVFVSTLAVAQTTNDSIRKADSITKAILTKKVDSINKVLKAIKEREEKEKKKNEVPKVWSVNGRMTFLFNQSSFTNWSAGGNNTVSGALGVNYDFNYVKGKWKWDNKIISSYGSSHISGQGYRKTDDRFEYNSVLGYKAGGYWYFSFFNNFISQFSKGFDYSKDPKLLVSNVLSPAYLSFAPGILWRKSEDLRINIAPGTARFTFVSDEFAGQYGTDPGKTSNFSMGFNLSGYLKFKLMKDLTMENIIALYADYLDNPQNVDVNYQMNLYVSLNKYLSMNLTLHTISDTNASSRIQFRELFGVGVNYTFHKI